MKCVCFQLNSPAYCHVDEQRLNGYYVACRTLKESSAKLSAKPESLYRRAEAARRNVFRVRIWLVVHDQIRQSGGGGEYWRQQTVCRAVGLLVKCCVLQLLPLFSSDRSETCYKRSSRCTDVHNIIRVSYTYLA